MPEINNLVLHMNQRKIKMWMRDPKNEIYGVITVGIVFVLACWIGGMI